MTLTKNVAATSILGDSGFHKHSREVGLTRSPWPDLWKAVGAGAAACSWVWYWTLI